MEKSRFLYATLLVSFLSHAGRNHDSDTSSCDLQILTAEAVASTIIGYDALERDMKLPDLEELEEDPDYQRSAKKLDRSIVKGYQKEADRTLLAHKKYQEAIREAAKQKTAEATANLKSAKAAWELAESKRLDASRSLFYHVAEVRENQALQSALTKGGIRSFLAVTGIGLIFTDICGRFYRFTARDTDAVPISEAAYEALLNRLKNKSENQNSTGSH